MVELDVEARQGDSGGPIFNERGELAGVLFGAGRGTTLGSFGGRVGSFLATLAPNIGRPADNALVQGEGAAPHCDAAAGQRRVDAPDAPHSSASAQVAADIIPQSKPAGHRDGVKTATSEDQLAALWTAVDKNAAATADHRWRTVTARPDDTMALTAVSTPAAVGWQGHAKNILAVIGALALALQFLRAVR
jgi:hypothetical protein